MNKNLKFLLLLVSISSITLGCNTKSPDKLSGEGWRTGWSKTPSSNNSSLSEPNICQSLTWHKVKILLISSTYSAADLETASLYISSCEIKVNDISEVLDMYSQTNNNEIKIKILNSLNLKKDLLENNEKIFNFYKSVAESEDIILSPLAVQGLGAINKVDEIISIYNSAKDDNHRKVILEAFPPLKKEKEENDNKLLKLYKSIAKSDNRILAPLALQNLLYAEGDKWKDWGWSSEVINMLEESVNKSFYKLSKLGELELLVLANRYPNSQFTKACIEYRSFTEGSYFGQFGGSKSVFRQPFEPSIEIEIWPKFLQKYPDHPSSDDAMYRIARAYEMKGDYENAILWYYKSSEAPDGSMRNYARKRILFIVDLLLSADALSNFLNKHPQHPLVPYFVYSRAVHFLREDKLQLAQEEMTKFLNTYKNNELQGLIPGYYDNPYLGWAFWNGVEEQSNRIKQLIEIHNKPRSDASLYEEAAFWFHNDFLAYNHLWQGGSQDMLSRFLPNKWEGSTTSTNMIITYKLLETARKGYEKQNRYLRSISLFEKMLKDYPTSKLVPKAKYSIGLNYYYLGHYGYSIPSDEDLSWGDMAIKSYKELIKDFPDSSLADDAMLVIASLSSKEEAVSILEKQLKDYPTGDRHEQAEFLLNRLKSKSTNTNISSTPIIGVGIKMENLQAGNGVVIKDTISDSPASKAGLQSGDIILQVNNQSIVSVDDVKSIISKRQPGDTISFKIQRQGQDKVVNVVVGLIFP